MAQGMCDVDTDSIPASMRILFFTIEEDHISLHSCSCRLWLLYFSSFAVVEIGPSLHSLSIRSLSWPGVHRRRSLERRYDPLEGSQQRRLYAQSRRVFGQIWVSVETQRYRTIPQRRLYGHVRSLCLGGGCPVTWWSDLSGVSTACGAWCLGGGLSFAW